MARALTVCATPGCAELGRPPACRAAACPGTRKRRRDAARPSAAARGYDAAWQALSRARRRAFPICEREGCDAPSEVTDHIVPHRGDDRLRLAWSNLAALCRRHHNHKTATQDTARDERGRFAGPSGGGRVKSSSVGGPRDRRLRHVSSRTELDPRGMDHAAAS